MIEARGGLADPFNYLKSLLSAMPNVEVLTLCRWTFEVCVSAFWVYHLKSPSSLLDHLGV